MLELLGNAQEVPIDGLVQLTVGVKPAQKPREGRNPATHPTFGSVRALRAQRHRQSAGVVEGVGP